MKMKPTRTSPPQFLVLMVKYVNQVPVQSLQLFVQRVSSVQLRLRRLLNLTINVRQDSSAEVEPERRQKQETRAHKHSFAPRELDFFPS